MFKKTLIPILIGSLLLPAAADDSARDAWIKLAPPRQAARPEFAFVENDPALLNVLIYGDSISVGYTQRVRENLSGEANVYRIHLNGGESGSFIPKMRAMHETMQDESLDHPWTFTWDVIHFNVGLHDLKYVFDGNLDKERGEQVASVGTYTENLEAIVAFLKHRSPSARLIFATTTPVPAGAKGRFAGDAAIYNAAALAVLRDHPDIRINDLYHLTKPNQERWWTKPGNVHFNDAGKAAQADQVSRIIRKSLPHR